MSMGTLKHILKNNYDTYESLRQEKDTVTTDIK